jgi:hypothetical protein
MKRHHQTSPRYLFLLLAFVAAGLVCVSAWPKSPRVAASAPPALPIDTWEPFTPSAQSASLEILSCGNSTFVKAKFIFSDYGYRVVDWGQVNKSGPDLSTDTKVERWTGVSAQSLLTTEQVYSLGVLAPGTYTFSFYSRGLLLLSKQFTVGPVAGNPVDDATIFVWQHYLDFLGRKTDDPGLDFWRKNLTRDCGTDAACLERKRIDTSAAFFLSIESQRTGFFVYRLYRASYNRLPRREELIPDARTIGNGVIVNASGWEALLASNTQTFVNDWINRADFKMRFDQLSDAQFVDQLIANMGVQLPAGQRDVLVQALVDRTQTRAGVLQTIVDDPGFNQKEFNPAFVLMQYFGYLQRNPDEGRDTDFSGFNFWLAKLNQFNGDYVKAEMVKAFISSDEYRGRFCSQ